jgi:hypothetical protein
MLLSSWELALIPHHAPTMKENRCNIDHSEQCIDKNAVSSGNANNNDDCRSARSSAGDISILGTESGTPTPYQPEPHFNNEFSKKESVVVNRLRFIVFGAIMIAAVSISTIVYRITKYGEDKEFESQFHGMSEQLTSTFQGIISYRIGVLGGLRVSAISHAMDNINTWPFVTLSIFQQRAATSKRMSKSVYLGIHPIVQETDRVKWEEYVAQEVLGWM